jgi:Protein of unknown function (DUF551)
MTDWKPIETAPKIYRQRIIVFRAGAKRYPVVGEDYWSDIYTKGCWAMSPDDEQPTHWMPLPEPPPPANVGIINEQITTPRKINGRKIVNR